MPGARRTWRDARGQSTAFVLSMLFVLVLFVSVVANVGQAVNRRIALQIVADTGAFTGASVMATGLNQLAFWNAMMQYAWLGLTAPMFSPLYGSFKAQQAGESLPILPTSVFTYIPLTECNTAGGYIATYKMLRGAFGLAYDAENVLYALRARREARRASVFNSVDLFPGEQLNFMEHSLADTLELGGILPFVARNYGVLAITPQVPDGTHIKAISFLQSRLISSWADVILVPATRSLDYACVTIYYIRNPVTDERINLHYYQYRHAEFKVWRHKIPRVDSFVWIAKAPATRALMFDNMFGGNSIPAMTAVGVAKPVGGEIEGGSEDYVAKMVPVASVMASSRGLPTEVPAWFTPVADALGRVGGIYDSNYGRNSGVRIVTH